MRLTNLLRGAATVTILACGGSVSAQVQTIVPPLVPGAKPVTVEHIKIHGTSLEGNLEGEAVDRDVIVFLPPSYQKESKRRYPVVYALHGFFIGADQWSHEIHVPQTIEGAFAQGSLEMIVVLPDSKTIYNGSMYSEFANHRRFREVHLPRRCRLHRRALPDDPRSAEPRIGRSLHGRLRCIAYRHEASGGLRRSLHHESLLHVAHDRRRPRTG